MLTMLLLLPGYNAHAIACHNDAFGCLCKQSLCICGVVLCKCMWMYILVACRRKRVMAAQQQCAEQRHIA